MNEIIELLKTAVAEILNETEPKDLSKNQQIKLDIKDNANPDFTPLCLRKKSIYGRQKMIRISEYIFEFFNEPESDFYQTLRAIFGYPYKQSFYSPCIFRYISHKNRYFSEISVLSHNSAKLELTLSTKASIHCQTKGAHDGQKY